MNNDAFRPMLAGLSLRPVVVFICLMASVGGRPLYAAEGLSQSILALTGGKRVKIVWMRDTSAAANNFFGGANVSQLVRYDTNDDTEVILNATSDDYTRPLISHDGNQIVYTDRVERLIYVVNWDGSNRRFIKNGFAGTLWYESSTNKQWVYYEENGDGWSTSGPVRRVNLNNTGEDQIVWNQTATDAMWMSPASQRPAWK